MKVELVSDWRRVLRRAWSVRFMVLAVALNGLGAVWFALADHVPIKLFVAGGVIVPVLALASRLIHQPGMKDDDAA